MRDTAALTDRLKESLTDLAEVRRIFCELGRYYDPVLGGAIMEVGHQRAIVEALVLVQQRYELRPLMDRARLGHHGRVLAAFLVLMGGAAGPLVSGQLAPLFWGGLVVVGLVIPLLVDLVGLKLPGAVPATLVLVGGFILRYAIVMANA